MTGLDLTTATTNRPAPSAHNVEAEAFLHLLDPEAEKFTFQTFDDNQDRRDKSLAINGTATFESVAVRLAERNKQGAGIFVTTNETDGKGREAKNIVRVRAVWQDDDGDGVREFPIEPHIVVNTSPDKYQRIWLVDGMTFEQHASVMARLVANYGSDPGAKDIARVLRLPGFDHRKVSAKKGLTGEPYPVRIVDQNNVRPYTVEQIIEAFPPLVNGNHAPKLISNANKFAPASTTVDAKTIADLRSALNHLRADDRARWVSVGIALACLGDVGRGLWLDWSATSELHDPQADAAKWDDDIAKRYSGQPGDTSYKTVFTLAQDADWVNPATVVAPVAGDDEWPVPFDPYRRLANTAATALSGLVPPVIERWAVAEGERMGLDPVAIAVHCLGVCSAVLTDDWKIQPKLKDTRWTQQARVWVSHIQVSGGKKNDQIKSATDPLQELERRWRKEWRAEMEQWNALDKEAQKTTPKPLQRRLTINDHTVEKLSELLSDDRGHPDTTKLLSLHEELASWFASHDAYRGGGKISKDQPAFLAAYDGGPWHVDRVQRGYVYVPNWSVVVQGSIQPGKMAEITKTLGDEGLLQRFIIVVPESIDNLDIDDDDVECDEDARRAYRDMVIALAELEPALAKNEDLHGNRWERAVLTQDAQPIRRDLAKLCRYISADKAHPAQLRTAASKWQGTFARLTLLFHCIALAERAAAGKPVEWLDKAAIGPEPARMAAAFVKRLVYPHACKFYLETLNLTDPTAEGARWISDHILARPDLYQAKCVITQRNITRAHSPLGTERDDIDKAMRLLDDWGWLARGSKPTQWRINPVVWERFAARGEQERARREMVREMIEQQVGR